MLRIDENQNIYLTRGDNCTLAVSITSGDEPYDFSNDTVIFGVKRSAFDENCIFEKEVDENANVVLDSDLTASMQFGDYLYSVRVFHENQETNETEIYTPIVAKFSLGYNVVGTEVTAE